ncbi:MAG: hypothetical protein CMO55_09485 [Verrucomicrobiales bacterium]|nr:hypothetical protein [Verrucomicrobiales bacterium]
MRFPFVRSIVGVAAVQMLVIYLGFQLVALLMKHSGYPDLLPIEAFSKQAQFVRQWALLFLLIPVIWTIWASWDCEENPKSNWEENDHVAFGILLILLLVGGAAIAIYGAYRSPIMLPVEG